MIPAGAFGMLYLPAIYGILFLEKLWKGGYPYVQPGQSASASV